MFYCIRIFITLIILGIPIQHWAQSPAQIDSLNHLPFAQKINRPKQLLPRYLKNAAVAQKIHYAYGEFEAYENASLLYYYLGKHDLELQYALKAIQGFEKTANHEKLARLYGEFGYRMKRTDLKKANYYMQRGLNVALENKLEFPLMGLYDNYGVLKEMEGRLDSAGYFYTLALELKKKNHDRSGLPYTLNNLGGLMLLEKKYEAAHRYFNNALEIREQLKDTVGICESNLTLADLDMVRSNYASAIEKLNFVIRQAAKNGNNQMLADAYQMRSLAHEKSGEVLLALDDVRNSKKFLELLSKKEIRDKIAELQVDFDLYEKEKALLEAELNASRNQTIAWILSLLSAIFLLLAALIYYRQKAEKRKAEVKYLTDLELERMRISRDLHDNIGSEMAFITAQLDIKSAKSAKAEEKEAFRNLASLLREASAMLRETIWSIRQPDLNRRELYNKIVQYAERRLPESIELIHNCTSSPPDELAAAHVLHIFRIAQEAINNSVKYSGCTIITITMDNKQLKIEDNGNGIENQHKNSGYGLSNMQHRAHETGL